MPTIIIAIFIISLNSFQNNIIKEDNDENLNIIDLYSVYFPENSDKIIITQEEPPPPFDDGEPPWGDEDPPPWGGEEPPWGRPPPMGDENSTFGDHVPPWLDDRSNVENEEEEGTGTTGTNIPSWITLTTITVIAISLFSAVYIQRKTKQKANYRVVHQLGKRRMLPKDEEDLQIYKQWGHEFHKNIPQWAYEIIHRRERASNNKITSGKISYKYLPKKLKEKRVIFCTYEKVEDRYYILTAYQLMEYDFIKGKEALKSIHDKIDIMSTLKTDPSKKKSLKFQIQMDEMKEKTQGDLHLDLIKKLLDQDENK